MFGNMGKMLKLAGELKTRLPEMKQRLAESTYSETVGGGAVTATVSGKLAVVDLKIDLQAVAAQAGGEVDAEVLEDLVKAAVAAAQDRATEAAQVALKELTGGMEIPGLTDMM